MEEAGSMNRQLASVRIKKIIDRIFSIFMLIMPDSPNVSQEYITSIITSITCT